MKSVSTCLLIAVVFAILANSAEAQSTTAHIACIQSGASVCGGDGFNSNPYGAYKFVLAQGYNAPGDGGGGTFANMGLSGATNCVPLVNTGTIVEDSAQNCFQRLDPNWGPKEYGAVGANGGTPVDDNAQLQAWLKAVQPHMGDADTYGTSQTLQCGPNATVQGPGNLDGIGTPLFQIEAVLDSHGNFTGNEVIDAKGHCRLSGVAINANNLSNVHGVGIEAVYGEGHHVTVDGYSLLENGTNNFDCSGGKYASIKDTLLTGASVNNFVTTNGCANTRLEGDIFQGAMGTGIVLNSDETILANGVIEESQGWGLDLTNARKVSVSAMHIQGNYLGGILLNNSNTISICGNHMEGNGGANPNLGSSAHISFQGANDNLNLCGNVYQAQVQQTGFAPSYEFDAASGTILTNTHVYDSPVPQATGVYSNGAMTVVPQLQTPRVAANAISGLTLIRDGTTLTQVDIQSGQAADSTATVFIQLPNGCNDNLATTGAGGLDVPPIAVTTYFFFAISDAAGGNASCIASTNPAVPSFANITGTTYQTSLTGETYSGLPFLYNIASLAGVFPGQTFVSSQFNSGNPVAIATTGTIAIQQAANVSGTTVSFTGSGTVNNMGIDMQVSDAAPCPSGGPTGQNKLGGGVSITAISTSLNQLTIHGFSGTLSSDCITVTSGYTVGLGTLYPAASTSNPVTATVYTGLYRMIGALYTYTNMSTTQVIPFTQDNDTFYLNSPVSGINTGITTSAANYTVSGIPIGISVAALGRCAAPSSVAGHNIFIFTPAINPGTPSSFPTAPGYSIRTTSTLGEATTSFPYRLDTNSAAEIAAQADVTPATLQCMTDGWVFHRGG